MGSSGRPVDLNLRGFDDTMDFFVETIYSYVKISDLNEDSKKYYLLGHSLGGMISSHYALRYENQIEKLILMSPVGLPEAPNVMKRDKFCQRNSLMARYGAEYLMDIWNNNSFCYLDVYRTIGYSASKIEAEMRFKN